MIFAAGLGRRMAPLTDRLPKPLIPVAGRPLIDHAISLLRDAGIERIVVNTHYLAPLLEAHLAGTGVETIHEPELLETGGGLRNALPLLGPGPVLTLNSDAVWRGENPVKALLRHWEPERMEALVSVSDRVLGHAGAGDFLADEAGRLRRGPGLIYLGAQILNPARLADVAEPVFSLNRVWDGMIADGGLYGLRYDGDWCDVGRPASIPLAEAMLAEDRARAEDV